jgi:hypothetical protein
MQHRGNNVAVGGTELRSHPEPRTAAPRLIKGQGKGTATTVTVTSLSSQSLSLLFTTEKGEFLV